MKRLTLADDHDLCIRIFLKEIDEAGVAINKRSVLHIGAHMGEEVQAYRDHAYSPIWLVEANPEILPDLKSRFGLDQDIKIIPTAVSDSVGETEFIVHKTKRGGVESSGLLNLGKLGAIVPIFNSSTRYRVAVTTIDAMSNVYGLEAKIGLLVLDIQGAEFLALKGARSFLRRVDAVICEVNLIQNYESCVLEDEIDQFFITAGFTKQLAIYHELYDESGRFPAWGECLWYREHPNRNPE